MDLGMKQEQSSAPWASSGWGNGRLDSTHGFNFAVDSENSEFFGTGFDGIYEVKGFILMKSNGFK